MISDLREMLRPIQAGVLMFVMVTAIASQIPKFEPALLYYMLGAAGGFVLGYVAVRIDLWLTSEEVDLGRTDERKTLPFRKRS